LEILQVFSSIHHQGNLKLLPPYALILPARCDTIAIHKPYIARVIMAGLIWPVMFYLDHPQHLWKNMEWEWLERISSFRKKVYKKIQNPERR
jgi:hypothetical protein